MRKKFQLSTLVDELMSMEDDKKDASAINLLAP